VTERFVVAGVAPARSAWFQQVARWSTAAVLPLEFVKCMSIDEVRARLASGRAFSVLLADAGSSGLDLDVIDQARTTGCVVIVVDDGRNTRDWASLGASAILPEHFDRAALLEALSEHASMLGGDELAVPDSPSSSTSVAWRGRLIAVGGGGGAGASTMAIALATGMGRDIRNRGLVALADLSLDADQALLHDARDVVPGIQELVEAHRSGTPTAEQIRELTFAGPQPYRLLLGLRRHRDWVVLRPRAFLAALDSLLRTFTAVVCDIDPDLEGEQTCGSVEVEERNLMARTVADRADVVAVIGQPGVKGLHRLVRDITSFLDHGVDPERIVPVINRAPRSIRARAELTRAMTDLVPLDPSVPGGGLQPAVFVPERRRIESALRDSAPMPAALVDPIAEAINAVIDRLLDHAPSAKCGTEPERIRPGSIGSWTEPEEATG